MFGQQTVALAPAPQPANWLCLDIETADAPPEIVAEKVAAWKAPSNWKPETVESKRDEYRKRLTEKAALLDQSPVICCAIETDRERIVFQGMDSQEYPIDGWRVIPGDDEKGMLILLRDWLDRSTTPETEIVGHGIRGFDLPKLRQAYVRHRLKLPAILQPGDNGARMFDTMQRIKSFSMELRDERYISLDQMARVLDLPRPKAVIEGAEVPQLYANGLFSAVLTYNAVDVRTTTMAYLLMTGQHEDMG